MGCVSRSINLRGSERPIEDGGSRASVVGADRCRRVAYHSVSASDLALVSIAIVEAGHTHGRWCVEMVSGTHRTVRMLPREVGSGVLMRVMIQLLSRTRVPPRQVPATFICIGRGPCWGHMMDSNARAQFSSPQTDDT